MHLWGGITTGPLLTEPTLRDVGIGAQSLLLGELRVLGQTPPVVDSRELLLDPGDYLVEVGTFSGTGTGTFVLDVSLGELAED